MEVILIILPLALLLGAGFLLACVRAIQAGQFDDLDTPAVRLLADEEPCSGSSQRERRPRQAPDRLERTARPGGPE